MPEYNRKMSYKGFSIGQKVIALVDRCANNIHIKADYVGVIVDIYNLENENRSPLIGVEWIESVGGHDCGGYGKNGYSWYVYSREIRHYNKDKRIKKV